MRDSTALSGRDPDGAFLGAWHLCLAADDTSFGFPVTYYAIALVPIHMLPLEYDKPNARDYL